MLSPTITFPIVSRAYRKVGFSQTITIRSLTIMKTKVMVMKMLASATTAWSAEMAMVMAVAVYATSVTVSVNTEKAHKVHFSPEQVTNQ